MKDNNRSYLDQVFFRNAHRMREVPDNSIDLIVTSPPYFNVKDYAKDGRQTNQHSSSARGQIGDLDDYRVFIRAL